MPRGRDRTHRLVNGDCLTLLPLLAAGSVDAVVTDPPYAEVDRAYGRLGEADWHDLMDGVVAECRRVLTPTGSAVFILQPNSRKLGSMRLWLWEFLLRTAKAWNLVQNAYWWNITAIPEAHAIQGGLMRPGAKYCLWFGPPDCYRNQNEVLWEASDLKRSRRLAERATGGPDRGNVKTQQSGHRTNQSTIRAVRRGGVTPFNILPFSNGWHPNGDRRLGHPAATPLKVTSWWVRYLCPPGGTVLDPFMGSGTTGVACGLEGRRFVGIEKDVSHGYFETARMRVEEAFSGRGL